MFNNEYIPKAGQNSIYKGVQGMQDPYREGVNEILWTLQVPDVMTIVKAAFDNVTAQDCNSWIIDCGYA